jgi:hypothetical protein
MCYFFEKVVNKSKLYIIITSYIIAFKILNSYEEDLKGFHNTNFPCNFIIAIRYFLLILCSLSTVKYLSL